MSRNKEILKQLLEKITVEEMDVLTEAIRKIILDDSLSTYDKTDTEYIQSVLLQMAKD